MSGHTKGDARRTALLESLDLQLQESSLDSITIADISRRAGVTRSAFYFYFENKAQATAALMEELYDESVVAAAALDGDDPPAARVEAMVRGLFGAWDRHQHLFRAMLDARATNTAVREMWDADRESFVPHLATVIEAAGHPAPAALASVLLELNDRMLERLALGGGLTRDQLIDTVVSIWLRSIYGHGG
ncbi:TetR/AcrR family transcriptional regulator [Nocardioides plantarum]|uniref:TetR/AcrR family transcriptional regulator n=1 Tax=Nocardioides plantarum TaxID=29299 RepID=A0ABV5KD91_9ACTN|nr:TetR/AcrR family transcriptional regulator [Nocardioides plantarum]